MERDKVAVILMRIVEGRILFAQYYVALVLTQSPEKNVVKLKVIETSIKTNNRNGNNIMVIIEKFKFMFDIII